MIKSDNFGAIQLIKHAYDVVLIFGVETGVFKTDVFKAGQAAPYT